MLWSLINIFSIIIIIIIDIIIIISCSMPSACVIAIVNTCRSSLPGHGNSFVVTHSINVLLAVYLSNWIWHLNAVMFFSKIRSWMKEENSTTAHLSSQLFFVHPEVVGTVSIAGEPCLPGKNDGYGKYDDARVWFLCPQWKVNGDRCNAIYTHSCGRDDDDFVTSEHSLTYCCDVNDGCIVGVGNCYPGLICIDNPNTVSYKKITQMRMRRRR